MLVWAVIEPSHCRDFLFQPPPFTMLDGVRCPVLDTTDIPSGSCDVEVILNDDGVEIPCMLVAGHVAAAVCSSGKVQNTLRPAPQWFMFTMEKAPTQAY